MMNTRVGLYAAPISAILLLLYHYRRIFRERKTHHPPSPTSLPLVGNLFSIPSGHEFIAFAKLGEQLKSDIVYLELLGQKIIVLNSAEAASDTMEKRSALYSDRPPIPMVFDPTLMNWSRVLSMVGYNDLWRHYRRIMNNWLNIRTVAQFDGLQERQALLLLQRLWGAMNEAQSFEHVRKEFYFTIASSMLQLAYGYKLQDPQDQFLKGVETAVHNIVSAGMQTNFFVNIFPALVHIPEWFPGTGWKRTAREWGAQQVRAKKEPYEWVKAQVASGVYQPSVISALLQDHKVLSGLSNFEKEERMKEVGFGMVGAGTDTSASFLNNLVAAMVSNPHAQLRAQQELDNVLGQGVLPSISDRERLPYIRNLIDEVLRFYPVAPLGVPHTCFRDDTYRGYDIQKGTIMIGNVWAICRDPRHYKDPEVFNPDRYLDPAVPKPPAFGWGRRKCPGIHFAETSIFITTALLLSVFTFSRRKDSSGKEIVPQIELERNALILELKSFEFELKPRSDARYRLVVEALDKEEE